MSLYSNWELEAIAMKASGFDLRTQRAYAARLGKRYRHDYRVNDFGRCPNCGEVHPLCASPYCRNPTHCPPDEPGEPFRFCDSCDAQFADVDGGQ